MKLTERPKLHDEPKERHFGVDDFKKWTQGLSENTNVRKSGIYPTDRDCIEACDICASPALFEL